MSSTQSTTGKTCEFCGKPLKVKTIELFGKEKQVSCYGSCGCERSMAKLEQFSPTTIVTHPSGHKCPVCGGGMNISNYPGYVSECPWCGYECVFKSDLDAYREDVLRVGSDKLEEAGVPKLFRSVEPDYERADFIIETGRGFFITGGSGTAKTLLASSIAKALVERGLSVRFVSSVDILSSFKDTYGTSKSEADVFADLNGCDLLVIDDLGKENDTSWASTMLYAVIDGRYGAAKPIVVTTNYSEGELVAKMSRDYDDKTARALMSRLYEMTERVSLDGPDRRLS